MVYTGTICTEAEITLMAGELVDATGNTETNHNDLVAQAESYLSNLMRYNVTDGYAGLNADVKRMLSEWAARYAGMSLISYNIEGFNRIIAEDMINIHLFRMAQIEKVLIDSASKTFLISA